MKDFKEYFREFMLLFINNKKINPIKISLLIRLGKQTCILNSKSNLILKCRNISLEFNFMCLKPIIISYLQTVLFLIY